MNEKLGMSLSAIVALALIAAIGFGSHACSVRNQEFRTTCVAAGGSFIEAGNNSMCIQNGSVVRR